MAGRPEFLAGLRKSDVTDRFSDRGLDLRPIDSPTVALEASEPPASGLTHEEARSG
jgi:hypothetical protein